MVKLSWRPPFFLREQLRSITAETSKGLFHREPFSPSKDIQSYYEYYEEDSVVYGAISSKAYAAVGRGFDTEVDEDDEAKALVDEFCEVQNLDALVPNITANMLIAGFCPVETFITSIPEKSVLKIIHPRTVEKLEWEKDKDGINIRPVTLIQEVGMKRAKLDYDKLAWFSYNRLGNDPFGVSDIVPILTYLGYKMKAVSQMDAILNRYASPKGIWKSKGDIKPIMDAVLNGKEGEDVFLGNLPDEDLDKVVEFLEIDPRARFWEYIQYIDQLIYVGLMAPNLFYFKDATEASARVLLEIVDRNIYAIGRAVKREIEEKWFKPFVELNGRKEVPKIKWRQKPPMKDLHLPDLVGQALQAGLLAREELLEILQNMGVTFEVKPELPSWPPRTPQQLPLPITQSLSETSYLVTPTKKSKPNLFNELLHMTEEECVEEAAKQGIDDPEELCKFFAQKHLLETKEHGHPH